MTSRLALAAALVIGLAACGDNASEEAADAAGEAMTGDDATGEATRAPEGDAPDAAASETPSAGPSETAMPTATPTPTPSASKASPTPTPTPTTVAAAGPPEAFKQCAICHKVEPGQNGLGPSLAGIYGARAAHAPGFAYSDAMKGANLTWNQANLGRYLTDPQNVVPGTTMAFAGEKDPAKRAAIIAYLRGL